MESKIIFFFSFFLFKHASICSVKREQEDRNVEQGPVGRPAVLRVVVNEIEKHEKFIL